MALVLAVATSPAQAAPGYQQTGEFVNGEFPGLSGAYSTGPRVAVDDMTGDVLAAYPSGASSTPPGVFIFAADGTPLGQVGAGSINPGGIAIDQANGDLYVADVSSGRIVRYTTDRANPPTYTLDASYNGPSQGSNYGVGQIGSLFSAVAVDPTNGDLLVADSKGLRVDRYATDGTFLASFDGTTGEAGKFTSLVDLAVSPGGEIYVVQNGTEELELNVFFTGPIHGSLVVRYAADGSGGTVLNAGPTMTEARAVGVDAANGTIVVATGGGASSSGSRSTTPLALTVFATNGVAQSTAQYVEPGPAKSVTGGIAISPSTGILYSPTAQNFTTGTTSSVREFTPLAVPGVSVQPPTGLTPLVGQAHGVVTPLGKATTFYFEYKPDTAATWSSTPAEELPAGEDPVPVVADLSLESAMGFGIRLVAEDGETKNVTPILSFVTPPAAPAVVTGVAVEVDADSAHLEGTLNALGTQATYQFEYGPTTSYGSSLPVTPGVAGSGRSPVLVETDIEPLQPGTTYHYRLVARGSGGEATGEDRTFQTLPAAIPPRAFELVSPLDKGNVAVDTSHSTYFASPDGNGMLFGTEKVSYPGLETPLYIPRVSAVRTQSGWETRLTDPPEYNPTTFTDIFQGTMAVSADQQKALVVTMVALTPGAVEGQPNMYIHNLQTNGYTLVATGALGSGGGGLGIFGTGSELSFAGASSDLSTVVVLGGKEVTGPGYPEPEALAEFNMYQWSETAGLSLVNVMPDGTPSSSNVGPEVNKQLKDPNQVSADGRRIFFEIEGTKPGAGLYMREGGRTVPVSASQIPGEEGLIVPAELIRASSDGRYVVFTTPRNQGKLPGLTPSAPESSAQAIYRYDVVTETLTYLTSKVEVLEAIPNTGALYYGDEEGGVPAGQRPIYYQRGGVKALIGTEHGSEVHQYSASPDGRYFAMVSDTRFTQFDNAFVPELYLYDSVTAELRCLSCRSDGKAPTERAGIGLFPENNSRPGVQRHGPRAVFDNGTVFFDTPEPLVPRDVNGERDVYEYQNGRTTLISDGALPGVSEFSDASPDGSNVFFTTNQRLVPEDKDQIFDLYDARVGGGFPAVEFDGSESCGAICGGGTGGSPPPINGSEAVPGSSKATVRKAVKHRHARCPKSARKKNKKTKGAKCAKAGNRGHGGHGRGAKGRKDGKKGAGR